MRSKEKVSQIKIEAEKFLNEKYHEEFVFDAYEMADIATDVDQIRFHSERMDRNNEYGIVRIYENEKNQRIYEDNYFGYIIRREVEKYIEDMIKSEFSNVKSYFLHDSDCFDGNLTSESNLEDLFIHMPEYPLFMRVYVKGETKTDAYRYEESFAKIENKLLESGHSYIIYIFVVSEEVYEHIERYQQADFIRFYSEHRKPDGENYYAIYHEYITDGQIG